MAEVKADEQVRGRSPQAVLGCPSWRVVLGKPGTVWVSRPAPAERP